MESISPTALSRTNSPRPGTKLVVYLPIYVAETWIPFGCGTTPMVPLWGRCTTHFRTYFSGWIESDVHWGYDLAFDPWPFEP